MRDAGGAISIRDCLAQARSEGMDTSSDFAQTILALHGETGREWLAGLPDLIAKCEQAWSISVAPPFEPLSYNYVAPAVRTGGTEAVLKIGVPNPELTTEIEALSIFGGRGCVRLLAVDRARGALLLERLRPGAPLWSVPDDGQATRIAARLMRQLWRPVPGDHPFPTTTRWALGFDRMRARYQGGTGPLPAALTRRAEALFRDLLASAAEPVLLHGDLHHDNILSAGREAWLAIDPKGVVGEPAYETGALLRNPVGRLLKEPNPVQVIAQRVEILASELDMDRHRLLNWGLAQVILAAWWCIEDGEDCWQVLLKHAEVIRTVMDG